MAFDQASAAALQAMLSAPARPQHEQEAIIFSDPLAGPDLEEGWLWIREDNLAWSFGNDGLHFVTKPGGIWGRVFAEQPAPPLLLRQLAGANACEVTVTMPSTPGKFGEQAGLFWRHDDSNYVKLVVEWMQDGSASVVLAREHDGEPAVCGQADLDEDEVHDSVRLRLELSADGSQLSGIIVCPYYMRLVARCSVNDVTEGSSPLVGVSAHGSTPEGALARRAAHFAKFDAIAVQTNRVQWGADAAAVASAHLVQPPPQSGYLPPPLGADFAGMTLSPDMSEEDRSRVAALLMSVSGGESQLGGPPGDEQHEDGEGPSAN